MDSPNDQELILKKLNKQAKIERARIRKEKRKENVKFILKISGRPKLPSIKALADRLWDLLTIYVRRRDGPMCRICGRNPGYALFHLIPQNEGNAVRYDPDNVVWGCSACNCGEVNYRARYARKFEQMFGRDYMDILWAKVEKTQVFGRAVQLRRPDYEEKISEILDLTDKLKEK